MKTEIIADKFSEIGNLFSQIAEDLKPKKETPQMPEIENIGKVFDHFKRSRVK